MTTINKKRSGDENIGKLIVFAITIVIAIGLVGLVSFFYTESRQQAVNTAVLSSTNSTPAEILAIPGLTTACAGVTGISYNAISNNYALVGVTTPAGCDTALGLVKWVKTPAVDGALVTYKMN